jgi:hypothetical protein
MPLENISREPLLFHSYHCDTSKLTVEMKYYQQQQLLPEQATCLFTEHAHASEPHRPAAAT